MSEMSLEKRKSSPQQRKNYMLMGLGNICRGDKRVIVGPGIGRDAAVIDFGKTCLVVKTDPITFTSCNLGWYSVNINANDIACLGAAPRWFLATLLLPRKGTCKALVKRIFEEVNSACQALGISLIGGHTEVTLRVDQPLMVGEMIGEVSRDKCSQRGSFGW